jgi:LPPG:FO 2-phospho-L-lactate transferase
MLTSLGLESSALGVARMLADLVDGFVLDEVDRSLDADIRALGLRTLVTDTVMTDHSGRSRLAGAVLEFAASS